MNNAGPGRSPASDQHPGNGRPASSDIESVRSYEDGNVEDSNGNGDALVDQMSHSDGSDLGRSEEGGDNSIGYSDEERNSPRGDDSGRR